MEKLKSIEIPNPQPVLAIIAICIALGAPIIQSVTFPFLANIFTDPVTRFLSLSPFWIAIGLAIFISARIEGIPLSSFGITRNTRSLRYRLIEMIAAVITGLVASIIVFGFSTVVRNLLNAPAQTTITPENIPPLWVMFPAWITGAFAEEFLFRSYSIERLTALTGNRWLSVVICVILFGVLHVFGWGWLGALTVALPGGIILTGLYLWRRSLWFVVVVHGIVNLPILMLALIAPYL